MLTLFNIKCGRRTSRLFAFGSADAISRSMLIYGNQMPISARRAYP
jgi:hypothetical protein